MTPFAYSLFSGSSGNCYIIGDEKTRILIDAGVSARKISCALSELSLSLSDISAIFVTHEHVDHVKGLEVISKNAKIPVFMTEGCARALIKDKSSHILPVLSMFRGDISAKIGDISVKSFPIPHDASAPVGYVVELCGKKFGFATDAGRVTSEMIERLIGCDAAVIEANHDVGMLKNGPYPYILKERSLSDRGHLSNESCAALARLLAENGTKSLALGHLSAENNLPSLAGDAVRRAVGCGCYIADDDSAENSGVRIVVARRDAPTKIEII